jgi:hypothetical protein
MGEREQMGVDDSAHRKLGYMGIGISIGACRLSVEIGRNHRPRQHRLAGVGGPADAGRTAPRGRGLLRQYFPQGH